MPRRMFAWKNKKKGYTLVEVLVSLVIVAIVFVGLTEVGLLALTSNINNTVRDEGVHVAEKEMVEVRSTPFASVVSGTRPDVSRQIRGLAVIYQPSVTVTSLNSTNKQVAINVSWTRNGKTYSHQAITIVRDR